MIEDYHEEREAKQWLLIKMFMGLAALYMVAMVAESGIDKSMPETFKRFHNALEAFEEVFRDDR